MKETKNMQLKRYSTEELQDLCTDIFYTYMSAVNNDSYDYPTPAHVLHKQYEDKLEQYKDRIKIYQEKLQKVITFHGYQNKEYIDKLLNKSSVYLMTSYTESFGIVLIEAMSHGVPCISFSSAEGACDIIENEKDGYLIRNRNNEKMAEKIVEVLNNQELLQTLGENARNKSLNYSSELVKKKWINLLKRG